MKHLCHATGCTVAVPPHLLMCLKHWRMVPHGMKQQIWRTYRPGQEITKTPTKEYMEAFYAAINAVLEKEALLPSKLLKIIGARGAGRSQLSRNKDLAIVKTPLPTSDL